MCASIIAAVVTALAAGGTAIASADTARKTRHSAEDAQKAALAQQEADAKKADAAKLAASKQVTPDQLAEIKAKIASDQAGGMGGLSPDFYTSSIMSDFPQFDRSTIDQIVKSSLSGSGSGTGTPSAGVTG